MIVAGAVVFAAGAAVMALELVSSRWLAPAFGFTLTTWALLISVTLLAGSVGAAAGGVLSRRERRMAGVLLLVAGGWIGALGYCAPPLVDSLLVLPTTLGALVASLAILAVPVSALAAVLPILAESAKGPRPVGTIVGLLVAASTCGSLAGTLLAAFVLVPQLGLQRGAFLLGAGLAALGAGLSVRRGGGVAAGVIVAAGAAVAVLLPSSSEAGLVSESAQGRVEVVRAGGGWTLLVDGIAQASSSPLSTGRGALLESRQYVELLPFMRPLGRRALVVGLGGGLVSRCFESHGIAVDNVEINPAVTSFVRSVLGYDGAVHHGDGRAFLRRDVSLYDFVVLDAFAGEALPSHLLSREALEEIAQRLCPRGIVCIHLIGRPAHAATAAVAATLGSVLTEVLCVRSGRGQELQDLFLLGSRAPLVVPPHPEILASGWLGNETFSPDTHAAPVLTDDLNPLDRLNEPLAQELRLRSRR